MDDREENPWLSAPPRGTRTLTESKATQVGVMLMSGQTKAQVSKTLNLTDSQFKKIIEHEYCKKAMREIAEHTLHQAKCVLRAEVAVLVPMIIDTIKHHLSEYNLKAVAPALKILGFDEGTQESTQDTTIQVILPGQSPKTVLLKEEEFNEVQDPKAVE